VDWKIHTRNADLRCFRIPPRLWPFRSVRKDLKWMSGPEINVLLVDDEPEFAELVHFFLGKQHDITVHSTNTVKKALEMIDTTE
jgi:hypothetical protein